MIYMITNVIPLFDELKRQSNSLNIALKISRIKDDNFGFAVICYYIRRWAGKTSYVSSEVKCKTSYVVKKGQ